MAMTRDEVARKVRELAPGALGERMVGSLRRSVRIRVGAPGEDILLGQSRFGGWPDVPAGFEWPTCVRLANPAWWKGYLEATYGTDVSKYNEVAMHNWRSLHKPLYDRPKALSLLAQINLAELPEGWELELPRRGQLLMFCDMGDELVQGGATEAKDAWRVVHFDVPADALAEMPRPGDEPGCRPEVRAVRFEPEWTVSEDYKYSEREEDAATFRRVRELLIGDWGGAPPAARPSAAD
jgi:hypothetical protein